MTEMRLLVTGVDGQGRSCVVEETRFDLAHPHERQMLLDLDDDWPSRPDGRGEWKDLAVPPGGLRWQVSRWAPNNEWGMHYTDTIDLELVVQGSVEVLLDDGDHLLTPGDCVIMNGVDHGWRVGPEGCAVLIAILGTAPPP